MIRSAVSLIIVVAASIGAVTLAAMTPTDVPAPVATRDVSVPAVEYPAACPGPLEVPVGDVDTGDEDLDASSDDRQRDVWADAPVSATSSGDGSIVDGPVASVLERVGAGDIAGLAAVTCTRPLDDQWLVGGSTDLGSSARLVVSNPGNVTVEATVTMYGPTGALEEQRTLAVGPQDQRDLLLEGLVADVPSLVVRVEATGGGVTAVLQDSRLDGFQPDGTDWVGGIAEPADEVVVAGIGVADADPDSQSGRVRVLSPDGATVSLTMVTAEGIVAWGGTSNLELEPGVVVDIPTPPGAYGSVEIEARGGAVVAGGLTRLSREADEGLEGARAADHTWVGGQAIELEAPRSVVVPDGQARVQVYAARSGEFVLRDQDGVEVVSTSVLARSFTSLDLDVPPGTTLTGEGRFAWTLRFSDEAGFLTTLEPTPTSVADEQWTVGVGPYVPSP